MKTKNKREKVKIFPFTRAHAKNDEIIDAINFFLDVEAPGKYKIDSKRLNRLAENPLFDLYLMELAGEIVGMGSLHYIESLAKKSAWIEDVVVHPKHQRRGLGGRVMKHIISEAKKKGVKHVELTSRHRRKGAHKFYEKLCFDKRKTNVYRLKFKKK